MKKVTVMMSTFNGQKFLRPQIDSILAQEGVDVTLYVRDDGSTDSTTDILQEYAEQDKLTWYQSEHTITPKSTKHKIGLSYLDMVKRLAVESSSDYYAFADQDDVWLPEKLSSAIEYIGEHAPNKEAVLYTGNVSQVDIDLNFIKMRQPDGLPHFILPKDLVTAQCSGLTCVMDSKMLELFAMYSGKKMVHHDWTLKFIALGTGTMLYDNRSFVLHRNHDMNVTNALQKKSKKTFWSRFKANFINFITRKKEYSPTIREIYKCYKNFIPKENHKYFKTVINYWWNPIDWIKLFAMLKGSRDFHRIFLRSV